MARPSETQRLIQIDGRVKCRGPHRQRRRLGCVETPCGPTLAVDGTISCSQCPRQHRLEDLLAVSLDGDIAQLESIEPRLRRLVWEDRFENAAREIWPNQPVNPDGWKLPQWVRDRFDLFWIHQLVPIVYWKSPVLNVFTPEPEWVFVGVSNRVLAYSEILDYLCGRDDWLKAQYYQYGRVDFPSSTPEEWRRVAQALQRTLAGSSLHAGFGDGRHWVGHLNQYDVRAAKLISRGEVIAEQPTDLHKALCFYIVREPKPASQPRVIISARPVRR